MGAKPPLFWVKKEEMTVKEEKQTGQIKHIYSDLLLKVSQQLPPLSL